MQFLCLSFVYVTCINKTQSSARRSVSSTRSMQYISYAFTMRTPASLTTFQYRIMSGCFTSREVKTIRNIVSQTRDGDVSLSLVEWTTLVHVPKNLVTLFWGHYIGFHNILLPLRLVITLSMIIRLKNNLIEYQSKGNKIINLKREEKEFIYFWIFTVPFRDVVSLINLFTRKILTILYW